MNKRREHHLRRQILKKLEPRVRAELKLRPELRARLKREPRDRHSPRPRPEPPTTNPQPPK